MTERQKAFAEHYVQSGNAAEAARLAGYSAKTAKAAGSRLLTFVDVQKYVAELQDQLRTERVADAQEVRETLTSFLRDGEQKTRDRLKAADQLLRSGGEYIPGRPAARRDDDDRPPADDDGEGVQIILPWTGRPNEPFNSYEGADGAVVPCPGIDPDTDLLIFMSRNQAEALESMWCVKDDSADEKPLD